jgi:signal recognition particle receptor subunit beta
MNTSKLTALRKSTAPYLPPPLLRLIHAIDAYAHLYHSSSSTDDDTNEFNEASMKILSSLLMAYLLYQCIKLSYELFGGKRCTVHLQDDSVLKHLGGETNYYGDNDVNSNRGFKFDDTVLLWGEMNSGKTALLHRLLFDHHNRKANDDAAEEWELPMTVASMVANAIYLTATNNTNNKDNVVRIIDYPGHSSLASQFTPLLSPTTTSRLVYTVDATQSIVESVERLYRFILVHPSVRRSYSIADSNSSRLDVLITCTKTDLKGAKNYKRIKIQMRNEIERLRKVDEAVVSLQSDQNDNNNERQEWRLKGKNIDLDNLGKDVPVRLYFVEVALGNNGGGGLEAVRDFVLFGIVPDRVNK